ADFAMTSQEGKLSVIGIFDRMFVQQTPAHYARLFLVAIFSGEEGKEVTVAIKIKAPSEKEVFPSQPITLTLGNNGKANFILDVANLPLPEIGEYGIEVFEQEQMIANTNFAVNKAGAT